MVAALINELPRLLLQPQSSSAFTSGLLSLLIVSTSQNFDEVVPMLCHAETFSTILSFLNSSHHEKNLPSLFHAIHPPLRIEHLSLYFVKELHQFQENSAKTVHLLHCLLPQKGVSSRLCKSDVLRILISLLDSDLHSNQAEALSLIAALAVSDRENLL